MRGRAEEVKNKHIAQHLLILSNGQPRGALRGHGRGDVLEGADCRHPAMLRHLDIKPRGQGFPYQGPAIPMRRVERSAKQR